VDRFVKNGTANFGRTGATEMSVLPPAVIPNIPVGRNFHLTSERNFRFFGIMEKPRGLYVLVHCSMASEMMESFPLISTN